MKWLLVLAGVVGLLLVASNRILTENRSRAVNEKATAERAAAAAESERLKALRQSNPRQYLVALAEKGNEATYLTELKILDPAQFEIETRRRTEAELTQLKARAKNLDTFAPVVKVEIMTRLAELEPGIAAHKKTLKKVSAEWEKIKAQRAAEELEQEARRNPENYIELTNFDWSKGGFDTVMLATFTLKNTAAVDIKDMLVSCRVYGESGTYLSTRTETVYRVVKAKSSRRIKELNMGFIPSEARRASCEITEARAAG